MNLEEIKARINPQYSDTIGTESHERKWLCDEIESLRQQLASRDAEVEQLREQVAILLDAVHSVVNEDRDKYEKCMKAIAATEQK